MDTLELVRLQAAAWGVRLDADRLSALEAFAGFLSNYEEANVIGARSVREVLVEHVLDSLSCFLFEPLGEARRLVDVGSGGGLPGLPLKVAAPRLGVALIEATAKKVRFLKRAVDTLSLDGVEVLNGRVAGGLRCHYGTGGRTSLGGGRVVCAVVKGGGIYDIHEGEVGGRRGFG